VRSVQTSFLMLAAIAASIRLCVPHSSDNSVLMTPPQLYAHNHLLSVTLYAVSDANGHDQFAFNGQPVAPVLRAWPGDTLRIDYINDLPEKSTETCAISPCQDMTNLHFHGMHVSPNAPQDDVITMMAMPGQSLHYAVQIPDYQTPGLFWYHTHPHGESERQVLDGMSGAIVIEGMDRYAPQVRGLPEKILIVRGWSLEHDPQAATLVQRVAVSAPCGSKKTPEEIFTVNGAVRPSISIAPGERQFWRIVNASPDRYVDLQVGGQPFEIVALDGMPLAYHDPAHPTRNASHVLVSPAGRLEAIVTGPPAEAKAAFQSLCVDTGVAGAANPGMVLADIVPESAPVETTPKSTKDTEPPAYKVLDLHAMEQTKPDFVVIFTEDKKGFYINGQLYTPDSAPMRRARVGTYEHWRIVNASEELHPFHIHQVHFLAFSQNNQPLPNPEWLDTVNVPVGGSVDLVMDFTDPVIRGMSLFHCHLLNHEDKGMMAKILFE
jgi:suppressor of ftsI